MRQLTSIEKVTEIELYKQLMMEEFGPDWIHKVDFTKEYSSYLLDEFLIRNNYDVRIVCAMVEDETCLSLKCAVYICLLFKHYSDRQKIRLSFFSRSDAPVIRTPQLSY